MSTDDVAVRLDGVTKAYGDKVAVENLSLIVPRGTTCGLLGPNGAGKTTTIRIILDIIGADRGRVEVLGGPLRPATRDRVGYLPEERGLYAKMKVRDLLTFLGTLKGKERGAASRSATGWLERLELGEWADRRVEELSKGMQQKVQFIGTVLHGPELLVLDEPFAGLDPLNVDVLRDLVLDEKRRGAAVLFSTHNMDQAERLCERVIMIRNARKVLDGPLQEIKRQAWLGGQRRILIAVEGDESFLSDRSLVARVDDQVSYKAIALQPGTDPQRLLEAALRAGARVRRFEVSEPSLHEIFVAQARG